MEPEARQRLSRELAEAHRHVEVVVEENRRYVQDVVEENRHLEVVVEGLRADVRLVAEALASMRTELKAEIQQFRKEVVEEFAEVRSMLRL